MPSALAVLRLMTSSKVASLTAAYRLVGTYAGKVLNWRRGRAHASIAVTI
jgi:hypothetical protein